MGGGACLLIWPRNLLLRLVRRKALVRRSQILQPSVPHFQGHTCDLLICYPPCLEQAQISVPQSWAQSHTIAMIPQPFELTKSYITPNLHIQIFLVLSFPCLSLHVGGMAMRIPASCFVTSLLLGQDTMTKATLLL